MCPMVCEFKVCIPFVKKRKFTPWIRTWKLKDPETAEKFSEALESKTAELDTVSNTINAVEDAWSKLKNPLLEAATEVCGLSKNHQWRPETWWWNDRAEDAIDEKRARYKAFKALEKQVKRSRLRMQRLPRLNQNALQSVLSGSLSLMLTRHLLIYPLLVMVFSALPNKWIMLIRM